MTGFAQLEIAGLKHSGLEANQKVLEIWNADSDHTQILYELSAKVIGPALKRDTTGSLYVVEEY